MLTLIAKFMPKYRALLDLPKEVRDVFNAVDAVLSKYASDPAVQAVRNEIEDVKKKIAKIIR